MIQTDGKRLRDRERQRLRVEINDNKRDRKKQMERQPYHKQTRILSRYTGRDRVV